MSQNGQTYFKNLAANAARFLKCVWPFWDIMHWRVKLLDASALAHWDRQLVLNVVGKTNKAAPNPGMIWYLLNGMSAKKNIFQPSFSIILMQT